jgi:hypothetical protein
MGRDDLKDKLHRDDFEKVEDEELLNEEDEFEDLIGDPVDNAEVEATAEQVRAQRNSQEMEPDDLEDLINVEEREREFLDTLGPNFKPRPKDVSTADEDEEEDAAPAAPPVDEDDDPLAALIRGDTWAAPLLGAPVADAPEQPGSPWIRSTKDD